MRIRYDSSAYYEQKDKLPKPNGINCIICGKKLPKYKRKYCSKKCFNEWYFKISGIKDWNKLKNDFLKTNPKCVKCGDRRKFIRINGDLTTNLEVDHIIPITKGGDEFDWNNLQTLCKKCHKKKTREDRRKIAQYKKTQSDFHKKKAKTRKIKEFI